MSILPSILDIVTNFNVLVFSFYIRAQWRRQDLLRGAKAGKYVAGHSRRTLGPGSAAARCLIAQLLMQLLRGIYTGQVTDPTNSINALKENRA